jgi:DNA-binding NarL/FixJ family response regulator
LHQERGIQPNVLNVFNGLSDFTLKEILAINPRAKVVIASGYAASNQVKAALQPGAASYVWPNRCSAELLSTVRKVMDEKVKRMMNDE